MMNNKGYTLVELVVAVFGLALFSGWLYLAYLVICALKKYIGA